MENHNIGWLMLAVIMELVLVLFCGHFGIGDASGGFSTTTGLPVVSGNGLNTLHWFYSAMTFGLGTGAGVIVSAIIYFLNFVILWCLIPLIIAAIQAIGTWVP